MAKDDYSSFGGYGCLVFEDLLVVLQNICLCALLGLMLEPAENL